MAAPLEVSWLEVRRLWESTLLSDQAVAERFGFGSKNSILRRRRAEGWTRDEKAIEDATIAVAIAALPPVTKPVGVTDEPEPVTPRSHGETQQIQASPPRLDVGVSAQKGADTSLSGQVDTLAPAKSTDPIDVNEERARTKQRQLMQAREMGSVAMLIVRNVKAVMLGPTMGGPAPDPEEDFDEAEARTPFGRAVLALRAINADRETAAGLAKTSIDMLEKAHKLENLALGVDRPASGGPGGQGALPDNVMTEEQLIEALGGDLDALELVANMSREIHRTGGRIVGIAKEPPE